MKHVYGLVFALTTLLSTSVLPAAESHIDKQAAAKIATQRFPGKVISVNPEQQEHTPIYRIKVLDKDGGMHTVVIHAQNGNILSAH